jgi:hypothetical protein
VIKQLENLSQICDNTNCGNEKGQPKLTLIIEKFWKDVALGGAKELIILELLTGIGFDSPSFHTL